jgi:hypothetical protein
VSPPFRTNIVMQSDAVVVPVPDPRTPDPRIPDPGPRIPDPGKLILVW